MGAHIFVDEAKLRQYIVVAAFVEPRRLAPMRQAMRMLLLPGQRRLHFTKERDDRRRAILSTMCELDVEARVYVAPAGLSEVSARPLCLEALIQEAFEVGAKRLVLERDDSAVLRDNRLLSARISKADHEEGLSYEHMRAHEENLLWIPDAIAWSFAKGGDWTRRIRPMLHGVRRL